MPGKTIAPVNASGFWEFLAIMGLLFLVLSLASGAPKYAVPMVAVQSTSTPLPSIVGIAGPEVEVLVTPTNDNKFDSFKITEARCSRQRFISGG